MNDRDLLDYTVIISKKENCLSRMKRFITLALCCFILIGNYFAYDIPAALNILLERHLQIDNFNYIYGLLYSLYSFPNVILPFFAGYLIERAGAGRVLILLTILISLGHAIFCFGVSFRSTALLLSGRILFGIGGESVSVVQSVVITNWFQQKELATALGLNLAITRLGSLLNYIVTPYIGEYSVVVACWVGFGLCILSLICACLVVYWLGVSPNEGEGYSVVQAEEASADLFTNISLLPRIFWLICVIIILVYGTIIPFNNIVSEFLQVKYNYSQTTAGSIMSIPDTICALLVPLTGYLVDRFGRRSLLLCIVCLFMSGVHFTLGFTNLNPIAPLVVLGLGYSLYGVLVWSSVAVVFSEDTCVPDISDNDIMPVVRRLVSSKSLRDTTLSTRSSILSLKNVSTSSIPIFAAGAVRSSMLATRLDGRRGGGEVEEEQALFKSGLTPQITRKVPEEEPLVTDESKLLSPDTEDEVDVSKLLALAYGISVSALNFSLTIVPLLVAMIRTETPSSAKDFILLESFFGGMCFFAAIASVVLHWCDDGRLHAHM